MNKKVFLTFFLLVAVTLTSFAQSKTVSLQSKDETYAKVFKEIERQTGYSFLVNESDLKTDEKVSVMVENAELEKVLQQILSGKNVSYTIQNNNIVIIRVEDVKRVLISGSVKDNAGAILPGVAIINNTTSEGTSTDLEGRFSIDAKEGDNIVFMFLGYQDAHIIIDNLSPLNVVMYPDRNLLEDAVVIGYGTMKKSDLTGSVASIKDKALESRPISSVDGLLQGKVAGLQVIQSSGEPGSSAEIRLRGVSSRQGSNSPLYVVDGFPYGDAGALKQINVNDITSIEVLKDASAASIYGSRGANGVILITTKSGKVDGVPVISLSTNTGIQWVNTSKFGIIRDPYLYAILADEERVNDTRIGVPKYIGGYDDSGFYFPSLTEIQSGKWNKTTDWEKEVLRPAMIQNHNVSVTGGGKANAYMLSVSYFDQDGTLIGSDYQSFSTRFKFDQNIGDKLKVGTNMAISYIERDPAKISYSALYRNPVFPVYDTDGSYYKIDPTDMSNPVMLANELKNESTEYDIYTMAYLNWNILDGLTLKAQSGMKIGASIADKYYPRTTELGNIHSGRAELDNYIGSQLLNEVYLTYQKAFGADKKHNVTLMGGYSSEVINARGSHMDAQEFVNDNLTNENMSMGNPEKNGISNYATREVLSSIIARANYSYANRYLLTLTARYDGSSKFGDKNKYGFFPSVALGWKIAEEPWLKDSAPWLDDLKIRASYGTTGNQAISVYGSKDKVSGLLNDKYYDGYNLISGMGLTQMGNNRLRWETTTQSNIGLDFGAFNGALSVMLDMYNKNTSDLLRQRSLPLSGGIGSHHSAETGKVWVNSGELNNKGVEITVNANIINTRDWGWSVNATASHNVTTITNIGEEGESMGLLRSRGGFSEGGVYWKNGQPMDLIIGYQTEGIVQIGDSHKHLEGDDALPGEFLYKDITGDGELNADDMVVLGSAQPKWGVGFGTNLTYKGFDLDVQFNGLLGHKVISSQKFSNAKKVNRWTVDNPTEDYPALRGGRNVKLSDWWIEDASYIRVSNITLGYTFDMNKLKHIRNLRIFLNCANPFVFTKFSGIDPELSIWDSGTYPKPTTFTLGLKLDF